MIELSLPQGRLAVLAVGAHPDDIEIGCGATLLALGEAREMDLSLVVATGSSERQAEAATAAKTLGAGADDLHLLGLVDGRLPAQWAELKQALEDLAGSVRPDVVLAPSRDDAHQDHRLLAELVPTVWRDALVLHYEIPKWDGDLGRPTHYVPLTDEQVQRKLDLLYGSFPSQHGRDWWDEELFRGLLRMRGVECRARYAEAFVVTKAVIDLGRRP